MPGLVPGIRVLAQARERRRGWPGQAWELRSQLPSPSPAAQHRYARNDAESKFARATNFFIIFVDGIFTTFIEWPFTNASHAIRENHAMSCV
jgi:hypothetical protein